jgi:predicted Fe-Mo cluster-binding NifX family protein
MRIMIATDGKNGLGSQISSHFGRCPSYMLIDIEGHEIKSLQDIENPFYYHHEPGQIPTFISEQGADVMIAGGMGQKAIGFFQRLGIEAISNASGTALRSLALYIMGELHGAEPCADSKQPIQ